MPTGLWVKQETDFDGMWNVFGEFADVFPNTLKDEVSRKEYTEKIYKNGFMYAVYLDDEEVMGFYSGYANDLKSKRAYGTLITVKQDAGLLRGRILKMLISGAMGYSKEQGMEVLVGEVKKNNLHAQKIYKNLGATFQEGPSEESLFVAISLTEPYMDII